MKSIHEVIIVGPLGPGEFSRRARQQRWLKNMTRIATLREHLRDSREIFFDGVGQSSPNRIEGLVRSLLTDQIIWDLRTQSRHHPTVISAKSDTLYSRIRSSRSHTIPSNTFPTLRRDLSTEAPFTIFELLPSFLPEKYASTPLESLHAHMSRGLYNFGVHTQQRIRALSLTRTSPLDTFDIGDDHYSSTVLKGAAAEEEWDILVYAAR
ncbi:hypothetical protein SUNI508_07570 [Seiridium unicorne]|uniref:Uncharacterized protein n=1 Tax=Seiridium unicorne TaxID=138068 RepID=A0ABR2UWW5_9PEZI